jgi:hypothetical protein
MQDLLVLTVMVARAREVVPIAIIKLSIPIIVAL